MTTRLLLGLSVLALCLTLASCGGGGGPSADININQAMNRPMPTAPHAGAPTCADQLALWESDFPSTPQELNQRLELFMNGVDNDPDSACAQLGLVIAMAAVAGHNAADYLGYDLLGEVTVASLAGGCADGACSPELVIEQGLQTAVGRPARPTARAHSRGQIPGTTMTTEQVQKAIRDFVLPPLANSVARLDALAAGAGVDPLITFTADSDTYKLYGADFEAIAATIQLVRSFLLELVAYGLNPGNYDWEQDLEDKDANGDGILTVAEYAPRDPFLSLISRQSMIDAGQALRGAVQRAKDAMADRTSDPDEVLNWVLPDDTTDMEATLQDVLAILSGEVTFTADYLDDGTPGTADVRINMAAIWSNPIPDVKDLLPPLTLDEVSPGDFEITVDVGDFPDKTFHGVFPGGELVDLIAADYDIFTLSYNSIVIPPIWDLV